jgi:transcriptional antiterminator NusG
MKPLGIGTGTTVSIDFAEGDTIAVVAGVWKDTVGVVRKIDYNKQTVTIRVELFQGSETPVELGFAEVRKLG